MRSHPRRARRSARLRSTPSRHGLCPAALVIALTSLLLVQPFGQARASAAVQADASLISAAAVLAAPVVGIAATPSGHGYWRVGADGGVLTAGDARFFGSAAGRAADRVVGIAATPDGMGYWLVDRRGDVYAFGDAPFRGSMGNTLLNRPVVGIAATNDGAGYWLVASDGGIFAFHAPFYGSTGAIRLNQPIVGMAAVPGGRGYWLVASDGGVFAFDAPFYGSTGAIRLNRPIVGIAASSNGAGYTLVASDGGVFRFPAGSPFYGSAANACPGVDASGVATSAGAVGYWITFADGRTYAFSPSSGAPRCAPSGTSPAAVAVADLFERLNEERAARGIAPLVWDPSLAGYASSWSANMATNGFRHSSIGGLLGVYNFVGENIASGSAGITAGSLHVAWMHSDGHRTNILAPGFDRVGVGVYCAPNGAMWATEDFGRITTAGNPPPPPPTPPLDPIARPDPGTSHC